MNSQHRDPGLTVRPPAPVLAAAKTALREHDREIRAFVVAALSELAAEPAVVLERLSRFWPAEKPRGRPRKDEDR